MKTEFKVLIGSAGEVELELNKLNDNNQTICVNGVSVTDNIVVIVIEIFN